MTITPGPSMVRSANQLELLYITNDPEVAEIAQAVGVERIFVDLENIGKAERQGHLDTVRSNHSLADIARLRGVLSNSRLQVRINPVHEGTEFEINSSVESGADILMLPYFHTLAEVDHFIQLVHGRARTCLLVETPSALANLVEILRVPGVDEVHFGLNDLHLGLGLHFMFELLTNGVIDAASAAARRAGVPFGIGGIGRLGVGDVPAELIVGEHYRLGSSMAILSRSFCDQREHDVDALRKTFESEIPKLRDEEQAIAAWSGADYASNRDKVRRLVDGIRRRRADVAQP